MPSIPARPAHWVADRSNTQKPPHHRQIRARSARVSKGSIAMCNTYLTMATNLRPSASRETLRPLALAAPLRDTPSETSRLLLRIDCPQKNYLPLAPLAIDAPPLPFAPNPSANFNTQAKRVELLASGRVVRKPFASCTYRQRSCRSQPKHGQGAFRFEGSTVGALPRFHVLSPPTVGHTSATRAVSPLALIGHCCDAPPKPQCRSLQPFVPGARPP